MSFQMVIVTRKAILLVKENIVSFYFTTSHILRDGNKKDVSLRKKSRMD